MAEYIIFVLIKSAIFLLPHRLCLTAGAFFGTALHRFDRKHRHIALDNLKTAFGNEKTYRDRQKIAKKFFISFGRMAFDILKFPYLNPQKKIRLFQVSGQRYLEDALSSGKGAILFSGHFGTWEFGPVVLSRMGKVKVIARPLDNPLLERQMLHLRRLNGAGVISKFNAVRPIIRSLTAGEMVAILIDQNILRSQAVFVDFFNKQAATTPAPAAFHIRTRAPLLPVFCYPASKGGYRLEIGEPLKIVFSGNHNSDLLKITQLCTKMIEKKIKEKPEYWLWIHQRWKTRPVEPAKDKEKGNNV